MVKWFCENFSCPDGMLIEIWTRKGLNNDDVYFAQNMYGDVLFGGQLFPSVSEVQKVAKIPVK